MDNINITEAVERYIAGQMTPDERVYFEQLRKSNPDIDGAVVEHTHFLQQLSRFDETRKFKAILEDTHIHLAEKGMITSPRLKGKARVVYMYNRYKRVAAIAASIAGITALTISALIWSVSPGKPMEDELVKLKEDNNKRFNQLQKKNRELDAKIEDVKDQTAVNINVPPIEYKSGGTGFLVDAKGYLVTNAHVVEGAKNIAVQNAGGKNLTAVVVYTDMQRDIAILKITEKEFKIPTSIPYTIRRTAADVAEPIYTLGYPRNEIVYGEGYLSSTTGYNGDTLSCQITIAANRGNSGSPVFNDNGELIGILNAKQKTIEGAVFAIHSKYILGALTSLQKDTSYPRLKIPTGNMRNASSRKQQVKKISDYVFMVKVD